MTEPEQGLRALRLSATALDLATDRTTERAADPSAGWAELVAAGIATGPGRLDPTWQQLLARYLRDGVTITVRAVAGEVALASTFSLAGPLGLGVTQRQLVERDPAGAETVVGTDPVLELALFPVAQWWAAVRRVLPPDSGWADPVDARPDAGPLETPVDPALVAATIGVPASTVTTSVRAHTAHLTGPGGRPGPPDLLWADSWALAGDGRRYWLPVSAAEAARVTLVGTGQLEQRLAWDVAGAWQGLAAVAEGAA